MHFLSFSCWSLPRKPVEGLFEAKLCVDGNILNVKLSKCFNDFFNLKFPVPCQIPAKFRKKNYAIFRTH